MNITEYQKLARSTAVYPNIDNNLMYPTLGLMGEFGEVAEKLKKAIRDDNYVITDAKKADIIKEVGDVYWYIGAVASEAKIELQELNFGDQSFYIDHCDIYESLFFLHGTIGSVINYCRKIMVGNTTSYIGNLIHSLEFLVEELSRFLKKMDIDMNVVLETNIAKLLDRKNRNVLSGSGDNR